VEPGRVIRTAARLAHIEPFYVMELAKAASQLACSPACDPAQGGEPMIFLNIGEPDFRAAPAVQAAAQRCIQQGHTGYTDATGLQALRECIAHWYGSRFGAQVDASRIVITAGASAALQLACLALFEEGDEVLMPDPSYPCNRHFVAAAGAQARLVRTGPATRFQLDAAGVEAHWASRTRGVVLATPSNPTGTSIARQELLAITQAVQARGGVSLVDEIYLGLSYDAGFGHSVLEAQGTPEDSVISINSFSKYFGMTGWRLGWLVLPPQLTGAVERLAQNLYICPSTLAQHAALACFEPESLALYEARRTQLQRQRDLVVNGLNALGLTVPVTPDGAFYAWFDCSSSGMNSWDFCQHMLHHAHVALTPGRDFGPAWAESHVRLSFAGSQDSLEAALGRLQRELRTPKQR
jgi:aspartate/methionine/tyrosine aminotransferase